MRIPMRRGLAATAAVAGDMKVAFEKLEAARRESEAFRALWAWHDKEPAPALDPKEEKKKKRKMG